MRILFIGDVVGRPGRRALRRFLPEIQDTHSPELTVVNAENAAGGFGVTAEIVDEFLSSGEIDLLTSGNHIWDKHEALTIVDEEPRLLRPQNYPDGTPGHGWGVATASNGVEVGVINVMGTVFMHPTLDCPFRCVDAVLARKPDSVRVTLVDFHAETTSEKMAMGWYLDEPRNHAVKDGVVIVAAVGVFNKVLHCLRRLDRIKFKFNHTKRCCHSDHELEFLYKLS